MTSPATGRRRLSRWRGALDVLAALRREPGITRAALTRRAGLSSGSANDIVARLRELELIQEAPAPAVGRGRPTMALNAHPRGPLVLAVELRHEDWRVAVAGLDGRLTEVAGGRHGRREPRSVLRTVSTAVSRVRAQLGRRLGAVSVAVAGTVQGGRLVQAANLQWHDVDLNALLDEKLPFLLGNDATLAGVAEARAGAGVGARAVLHLTVEVGLGGILVVDGAPVTGATGAGGEFGHMCLVPNQLECRCGARGCWDLLVDGRAMARHLGEPAPENPHSFASAVLERAAAEAGARRAVEATARDLGAGTAGLVNALDPEVVTLGGLAIPILRVASGPLLSAYRAGLMAFRHAHPPEIRPARFGDDGALNGAVEMGWDAILTEDGLDEWASGKSWRE